jgi:hypothetical protein
LPLSLSSRWFFSFSARSMYSEAFARIISFDLAFFSPTAAIRSVLGYKVMEAHISRRA